MTIGVIIARFQVPELTLAHKYLIHGTQNLFNSVGFLLGVGQQNKENPLTFLMREGMVREWMGENYPKFIAPVFDCPGDNEAWSKQVDELMNIYVPLTTDITLVGGRDSFIPCYKGRYKTHQIPQLPEMVERLSGTVVRESVGVVNSPAFRRGVIWQVNNGR